MFKFPYTNFHELNLDWIINTIKKLEKVYETLPGTLQIFVNKWLEEHPEATTTVNYQITTKIYENVHSLVSDLSLVAGDKTATLGYYSTNDGGGAYYEIREKTNDDVVSSTADDSTTEGGLVLLSNGLVAELICDEYNVKQFGAKTGSEGTNPAYAQKAFEAVSASIYRLAQEQADEFTSGVAVVHIPIGSYFVHDIDFPCGTKIYGDGYQSKIFHNYESSNDSGYAFRITGDSTIPATHIENMTFKGGWTALANVQNFKGALFVEDRTEVHIFNVWFGSSVGCYLSGSYGVYFTSCTFDICATGLKIYGGALTQLSQCFFYGNTSYSVTGNNTRGVWFTDCSFGNCGGGLKFDTCEEIRINNVEFTDKSSESTDGAERNANISNIDLRGSKDISVSNCTFNRRTGKTVYVNTCENIYLSDLKLETVTGYSTTELDGFVFEGNNNGLKMIDISVNSSTQKAHYTFNNAISNARLVRCTASGDAPITEPTVNGGVFCFNAILTDVEMHDCLVNNVTAYCGIGLVRQSILKVVNCIVNGTFITKLKTYNNAIINWISNEVIKHIVNVGASNSFVRMYYSNNTVTINGYVRGMAAGSGGWCNITTLPSDIPMPTEEVNYAVAVLYGNSVIGNGRLSTDGVLDVNIPNGWDSNTSLWFNLSYMVNG